MNKENKIRLLDVMLVDMFNSFRCHAMSSVFMKD